MAETRLERARRRAAAEGALVDLIDTNFHTTGLVPPSAPFRRGLEEYLDRRRYRPDPQGALFARESIAAFYAGRGFSVSPEDVVLCASTSEAYALIFSTFGRAEDSVALPLPGYPLAEELARHSRLLPRWVRRPQSADYAFEAEALAAATGVDTAFLVAVSPDNPTGRVVSETELRLLNDAARKSAAYLIWDEVFCDLLFEEPPGAAAHPLGSQEGPVTFVLNGASKLFASPDLKIGWAVLTGDPKRRASFRERLATANDHFLSASSFGQAVLPYLFLELESFRSELRGAVARRRELFLRWLEREPLVAALPPAGGVHALCRLSEELTLDDEALALALLRGSPPVYVHPGYLYGCESGPASFVISLLTPEDRLERGLQAVSDTIHRPGAPGSSFSSGRPRP